MHLSRVSLIVLCGLGLMGATLATPAEARPTYEEKRAAHKLHVSHKHVSSKKKHSKAVAAKPSSLRQAQMELADLGYYTSKVDGKNGAQTRSAIKNFQRDFGLKQTGTLNAQTQAALTKAHQDMRGAGLRNARKGLGLETLPTVVAPVIPEPQVVTSRYGKIDIVGDQPSFEVKLNGQTLLTTSDQQGPLKVSNVYDVNGEDAVLFTVYRPTSPCFYQNFLVVVRPDGSARETMEIPACSSEPVFETVGKALLIGFPNGHDGRAVGTFWRYENGRVTSLL